MFGEKIKTVVLKNLNNPHKHWTYSESVNLRRTLCIYIWELRFNKSYAQKIHTIMIVQLRHTSVNLIECHEKI